MMLKVTLTFLLFYIFIPSKIFRYKYMGEDNIDKFFINLIHSNFITIIAVHLLVLIKVYETLSLIFCYILVYFILNYINGKTPSEIIEKFGVTFITCIFDAAEKNASPVERLKRRIVKPLKTAAGSGSNAILSFFTNPFQGLVLFGVFLWAAYVRYSHSFTHLYYGASDGYVHLAWAKYLGNNVIYKDGIYPYGYEAVISALNKLSFIDPYMIVRFIGPFEGMLIVLSIYYVLYKTSKKDPIIVCAAVFIYAAGAGLPIYVWRQISALSQEYATIFFLPGIYFFNQYFNTGDKSFLILSAESFALTLLIHSYVAVLLTIGYIITCIIHIRRMFQREMLKELFIYMPLYGVIGMLPMAAGYLSGIKLHSTINYIQSSAKLQVGRPLETMLYRFREDNMTLNIFLICAAIVALINIIAIMFRKNKQLDIVKTDFAYLMLSLILYLLYRASSLDLPVIMDINRLGIFLSIAAVVVFAQTLKLINYFFKNRKLLFLSKLLAFALIIFMVFGYTKFEIPVGERYEYDTAVYGYLKIKNEFPKFNWTIVSPVEQYQESLGYGWHYNLWEFADKLSDPEIHKIEITTDYVFVFVEKYPLNSNEFVSLDDSKKVLPRITGETSEYYKNITARRIIESRAYFWAEDYMKKNKNMTVYYEDKYMKIYMLMQDGNNPVNLKG